MKKSLFILSTLTLGLFSTQTLANVSVSVESTFSQQEATQSSVENLTGVNYEVDAEGKFVRLRSTGTAELEFGDAKDIRIATQKATMRAKANIAKFLSEQVTSEEVIDNLEKSKTTTEGQDKKVLRETIESYAESIKVNANAFLKGVITTKTEINKTDKTVVVEVGLSPRTMQVADDVNRKPHTNSTRTNSNDDKNNEVRKIKNYDNF